MSKRPTLCRNALRDAGKPYPRSGCVVCQNGGMMGCPYDHSPSAHLDEIQDRLATTPTQALQEVKR